MSDFKTVYPFKIKLSFEKILDNFKSRLDSETNPISKDYMQNIIDYSKTYPELFQGIENFDHLGQYDEQIGILLNDLFPDILTHNEIKVATVPLQNKIFRKTKRFEKIIESVPEQDYKFLPRNFNLEKDYILACIIILNTYYGYNVDFFRPEYYDIPDANGQLRNYRLFVNADFVEILPTAQAKAITQEDVDELLNFPDDVEFWKKKFPPESWIIKGFTILNLTDVTVDNSISEIKTLLLNNNILTDSDLISKQMKFILSSIFNLQDLEFGFALFDDKNEKFQHVNSHYIESFILDAISGNKCKEAFCHGAYSAIVSDHNYFCITDVEMYKAKNPENKFANYLSNKSIQSVILAPVSKNGTLLAILELVCYSKNKLNSINAKKLDDIVPYFAETVENYQQDKQNRIKAIIQSEYTSIHPSVEWRFQEEAEAFLGNHTKREDIELNEISFKDVHPLFGQIDIMDSSVQRNTAIQKDLTFQLNDVFKILKAAYQEESIPIYEQLMYRISDLKEELSHGITTTTEQKVNRLLHNEIHQTFHHILQEIKGAKALVESYFNKVNSKSKIFHKHRSEFDDTVASINKKLANFIDSKQIEAQKIFPHYFDRYKTDGVEHNMYIGQSIAKNQNFSPVILQSLRLWQLQVMCEMENEFYCLQGFKTLKLNCRSLLLAFNNVLSIHYRMDEKHFDVDGSYNARYEIIKKRIDKAFIKGTQERITSKGKLTIVYSHKESELEYFKYIDYLQKKKMLTEDVEMLEVENLQGVSGLKAIRVGVLYQKNNTTEKPITYDDLIESLNEKSF